MKHISFSRKKECERFIKNHHGSMTQPEMAAQLKIGTTTVTRLVNELGLKKRHYIKRESREGMTHSNGIFNVRRYRNWLIG